MVAVTIERGGFGAETAAPAAREILDELLTSTSRTSSTVETTREVFE